MRCGPEVAALDFDTAETLEVFFRAHPEATCWPRVTTGRGFHLWVKPVRPVPSQRHDGVEVKCLGSYVVAPPSVHPNGTQYTFEVGLNSSLPEVDLEEALGLRQIESYARPRPYESIRNAAPSDFALHYGESSYPRSMCGLATKVLTRSDGKVKHLLSLRDWRWDSLKCAPLSKRYWPEKLKGLPFRFILRLPSMAKPTTFLRRVGKPQYVHIVANGESWLFLLGGGAELIWAEARKAGYDLVAGAIDSDPTPEEIKGYLKEAFCREEEPLNTRRKITHSRKLPKMVTQDGESDESKQPGDCGEGEDDMKIALGREPLTWESEVVMKPIEQVASELERQGWRILWQSEVEALAIRGEASESQDMDIVELLDMLGVKLKRVGRGHMGPCPFHDDHNPSLSVNREKGLWHCFGGCGGGRSEQFIQRYQMLRRRSPACKCSR